MTWLAGVDGCRVGWFRACRESETGELRFDVLPSALDLVRVPPAPSVIAIDIPIGLPDAGARRCDVAARKRLGSRRSSVFPAPVRAALDATTQREASEITERIDGRRVAAQAWNLFRKIREVDALLQSEPTLRTVMHESHPEMCFATWNGGTPMRWAKRAKPGRIERARLAEAWLGEGILARARGAHLRRDLADDDILDAIAVLWTAHRIAEGTAGRLPDSLPTDATGLPMQIVY